MTNQLRPPAGVGVSLLYTCVLGHSMQMEICHSRLSISCFGGLLLCLPYFQISSHTMSISALPASAHYYRAWVGQGQPDQSQTRHLVTRDNWAAVTSPPPGAAGSLLLILGERRGGGGKWMGELETDIERSVIAGIPGRDIYSPEYHHHLPFQPS